MVFKSMNSGKQSKSLPNLASLPLAIIAKPTLLVIAFLVGGSSVNAVPLSSTPLKTHNSLAQVWQLISQSNEEPPEVIIGEPNSSPYPPAPSTQSPTGDTRFTCEVVDGEYTVMYYPESQPDRGYPWAIPGQLGGGWSPDKRCNEITRRLESYRDDGLLEMSTGVENDYNTICVTTQIDPTDCRIVLTVPPGQDPVATRNLIFDNLLIADDGQQTQGVYTYGDRSNGSDILEQVGGAIGIEGLGGDKQKPASQASGDINLRPFLDPADGGTGEQLTDSKAVKPSSSPADRPDSERKPALFQ